MTGRNKWVFRLDIIASLFVLVFVSWVVIETGIEVSSRADFCGICHSMEPMVASYRASTHGGNNPRGIMSACTDCHVSHENVFTHFIGKAKSGTHDIWVTLTTDTTKHDWQALRLKNEDYVYDSGCLTCHRNLEAATQDKKVHNNYFEGVTDSKCVNCHEEVGHSNLNKYLLQNKYRTVD
ncbi:MAG: NapC/NirT family cytochrome c [Anaerolineales bacterium]|nr:NapC/NirT family cytochrome c [Anaerolineales bacterium]